MFNFIKSIFDDETMGEEIINANMKTYEASKIMIPNGNKLDWLKATYLGRVRANGMPPINTDHFSDANYVCIPFSKLPDPLSARMLGIFMIQRERPDICAKHPKFMNEFNEIINKYNVEPISSLDDVFHR
tara:strand:- start:76 stop:465 length:390 start_codon:yes stop_codon:yes gene_type:complete